MELQEFVTKTLQQILEGVKDAQNIVSKEHGAVNPEVYGSPKGLTVHGNRPLEYVDFDVAVATSEGSDLSGGISVMGIGAKGATSGESSSVSRIKFRVPIALPG